MSYTVLVPEDVALEGRQYLADRGYTIRLLSGNTAEQVLDQIADCEGIMVRTAPCAKEAIAAAKNLKVIAKHGVGVDSIDVEAATQRGIYVTFGPESNANSVAEHAVGLLLCCARYICNSIQAARNADWDFRFRSPGVELEGKTLGLIGAGRIGTLVMKKAVGGFGMNGIVYDPYVKEIPGLPGVKVVTNMDEVFKKADFVSVHVPLVPATTGLISRRHFEMMKNDAFFINAARGPIVVEKDLYDALKAKRIAGAALDVFDKEPPDAGNPLFQLDNVLVTPHIAASTKEASIRMSVHAAMGIDDVLSGRLPKWPFNKPLIKG
jgi:D-3-phosphoglycerate dehydrogenase